MTTVRSPVATSGADGPQRAVNAPADERLLGSPWIASMAYRCRFSGGGHPGRRAAADRNTDVRIPVIVDAQIGAS
jgi:hypothetical protein